MTFGFLAVLPSSGILVCISDRNLFVLKLVATIEKVPGCFFNVTVGACV